MLDYTVSVEELATLKQAHNKECGCWKGQSTSDIVRSLRPGAEEALRVKSDGRIFNGDTRIKVLEERGYNVNSLSRELF